MKIYIFEKFHSDELEVQEETKSQIRERLSNETQVALLHTFNTLAYFIFPRGNGF